MTHATEIASYVLAKIAAGQENSTDQWNTPRLLATGGGLGLGGGLLGAGVTHRGDINALLQQHYTRPKQEAANKELMQLLKKVRKQNPAVKDISDRKLTKVLLQNKGKISPEAYHVARRGYEEGLAGLSKNRKLTQLLKKRLIRGGVLGAGLGLGAGMGAGLLASIGRGHFDNPQS